tara:strand:- start:600 stop:944 length:345 start_codon:yes stop_codon:yes gene_type:complete
MPHIKLEHTKTLSKQTIQSIFESIKNILLNNTKIKEENCKFKAIQYPIFNIGENKFKHFYHLKISILIGRPQKIKEIIKKNSLNILAEYSDANNSLSVEIHEINPDNYITKNDI